MKIQDLDTPALIIDLDKLEFNIRDMANFARQQGVKLRPHIKSHKIPEIALMQVREGAVGVTVAKLGEAEVMAQAGIEDILIANQITGPAKIKRLLGLAERVRVCVAVDSLEGAGLLSQAAVGRNLQLGVVVEVDSGLRRCGVLPGEEVVDLAKGILELPGLSFQGIMTHAGHVYGMECWQEAVEVGRREGELMLEVARLLEGAGIAAKEVSVGSTPTAKVSGQVKGVTEIRPGNYVFYDAIQMALGVVGPERCALTVLSTVISTPAPDRVVLDAGSKTLALDKGAHGASLVKGFGIILGGDGLPERSLSIERLSEEHGVVAVEAGFSAEKPKLNARVRIIPNHACTVINLFDQVYGVRGEVVETVWKVAARGKLQ